MIEMFTARTSEVDEIDEAVREIKSQIDFTALKKNSGGILFCHMDFVVSGLVEALCKALPFPVMGMTSMANADGHGYSLFELSLTVLTSDEVTFEVGMTENIDSGNYIAEIGRLCGGIREKADSDPALIIAFMPSIEDVSGYKVVAAMDSACGGLPIWGAISNTLNFTYEQVFTICNGRALRAGLAMLFVRGPVEPKFIVSSIPERNIANNRAIITKSDGAVLYEVNDLPVLEYLANIGLIINKENITTTPLMIYYDEAQEPVALGFYRLFEDGSLLTGGDMPLGTSFAVGSIDTQGIFESAERGLKKIEETADRQATLLLPCITRYIMLAPDQEAELRLIQERLSATGKPFMMGYSGGEICPMPDANGMMRNRFHNYTFCACVL